MITSEFFGKFNIFKAIVKASVPLAQPIAYLTPQKVANAFSNSFTKSPKIKFFFLRTFFIQQL